MDSNFTIKDHILTCCTSSNKTILIPDEVRFIAGDALCGCTNLKTIFLPACCRYEQSLLTDFPGLSILVRDNAPGIPEFDIQDQVLLRYNGIEENVVIPQGVTHIHDSAFAYCYTLKSVTIPDSVISIGYDAFSECTALRSVEIPGSVKEILFGTFCGCDSLESVVLPDTLEEINEHAFSYCKELSFVLVPGTVHVNEDAFRHCDKLKFLSVRH